MAKPVVIVMGVSGCGKTTIGSQLARALGRQFADADTYHPLANVEKMRAGLALDDQDRAPWLATLNQLLKQAVQTNQPTVLACSALKQTYRDKLAATIESQTQFVHLHGNYELILARLQARQHAYMPSSLLSSQFALLEIPVNAIAVDITQGTEQIVKRLVAQLHETHC
jgi:gluconokinase